MAQIAVQLGRERDIAMEELVALFAHTNSEFLEVGDEIAVLETPLSEAVLIETFKKAGSLVKIIRVKQSVSEEAGITYLAELLSTNKQVTFGISMFGASKQSPSSIAKVIKETLKEQNISVRFVLPKEGETTLNAGSVIHNDLDAECIIIHTGTATYTGITIATQDIEDWGKRDYEKPARDAKRGMLPPKLACTMVNLLGLTMTEDVTVLDPFCGLGTVAIEVMLKGGNIVASDADPAAINGTKENVAWTKKEYALSGTPIIMQCDSREIGKRLKTKVSAIVTECYLGNTAQMTFRQRSEEAIKLKTLYIECFKSWKKILVPGARLCVAIPEYHMKDGIISIDLAPELHKLGYTFFNKPDPEFFEKLSQNGNLLYMREFQIVARELLVLEYRG